MKKLLPRQKAFCDYYLESGNATKAYKKAYPGCKTDGAARTNASKLLTKDNISQYIYIRNNPEEEARIKEADEILILLTSIMRGEEPDAFGLPTSIKDRTRAAKLLLKRYKPMLNNNTAEKMRLKLEQKRLLIEKLKNEINKGD